MKHVAIVCAVKDIQWDATNVQHLGFGEAEQAVVNLAEHLAREGYLVDVWCAPVQKSSPKSNPRYLEYRHFREFFETSKYYNTVVWWRYPGEVTKHRKTSSNILWMHDYVSEKIDVKLVDKVVFLSDEHRDGTLARITDPVNREEIQKISAVIPNPFPDCPTPNAQRDKYRCVYLSNHAHGLEDLLKVWPQVRATYQHATLQILYDSQTWGLKTYQEEWQMKERIFDMRSQGVVFQGTLNQSRLYKELEKSSFWLYPCTINEPFCIQGIQAQHLGVIPIVSNQPFLASLAPDECVVEDSEVFIDTCLKIMSLDNAQLEGLRVKARSSSEKYPHDLTEFAKKFATVSFPEEK